MARLFIFVSVVLLLFLSLFLFKKSTVLLAFTQENKEKQNQKFIQRSACIYLLLAVLGISAGIVNHSISSLIYILLLFVTSGIFSYFFAKKIR